MFFGLSYYRMFILTNKKNIGHYLDYMTQSVVYKSTTYNIDNDLLHMLIVKVLK